VPHEPVQALALAFFQCFERAFTSPRGDHADIGLCTPRSVAMATRAPYANHGVRSRFCEDPETSAEGGASRPVDSMASRTFQRPPSWRSCYRARDLCMPFVCRARRKLPHRGFRNRLQRTDIAQISCAFAVI